MENNETPIKKPSFFKVRAQARKALAIAELHRAQGATSMPTEDDVYRLAYELRQTEPSEATVEAARSAFLLGGTEKDLTDLLWAEAKQGQKQIPVARPTPRPAPVDPFAGLPAEVGTHNLINDTTGEVINLDGCLILDLEEVPAPRSLDIVIVADEACPDCGAIAGHADPVLDWPNRPKVGNADGSWAWRCYNPTCSTSYYTPST